jgi:hypothetical protein
LPTYAAFCNLARLDNSGTLWKQPCIVFRNTFICSAINR